jgi:DNA-binding NarL/FixJ family response regulator
MSESNLRNPTGSPSRMILVVDDSLPMRAALCDLLEVFCPDYTIQQADCAETALSIVSKRVPDLVLMDIALPGMDGLTCLKEILCLHPQVQSVVISYHEEHPYHQKALNAGANAYIVKRRLYLDLIPVIKSILNLESGSN